MDRKQYMSRTRQFHEWCDTFSKRTANMVLTGKATGNNDEFQNLVKEFDRKLSEQRKIDDQYNAELDGHGPDK